MDFGSYQLWMQVKMMRQRLVRKTFEMIEKIAKDEDKEVLLLLPPDCVLCISST